MSQTQKGNVKFSIEKIGEKVKSCEATPDGMRQLVLCHYKCTVSFDELYWSDYPSPLNHRVSKVEVICIDKEQTRPCKGIQTSTSHRHAMSFPQEANLRNR
jgi:hypothetical protein